jgi:hypothetical protein
MAYKELIIRNIGSYTAPSEEPAVQLADVFERGAHNDTNEIHGQEVKA